MKIEERVRSTLQAAGEHVTVDAAHHLAARRPRPRRSPMLALAAGIAAVAVFGAVAFGLTTLLTGSQSDSVDVLDSPAVAQLGPLVIATNTLDLDLVEAYWPNLYHEALLYATPDFDRVVRVETTGFPVSDELREQALASVQASHPSAQVSQSTHLSNDTIVIDDPDTGVVGALVITSQGRTVEVVGSGVDRDEMITFVEGLQTVPEPELAEAAAQQIGWDLSLDVWPADQRGAIESLEGVASVTPKPDLPYLGLDAAIRDPGNTTVVATTVAMAVESNGAQTAIAEEPVDHVDVYLTLEPGVDVEEFIERIPDPIRQSATASPAHAIERAESYLALMATDGELLHDRPVYQAPFGPEPQFDTTDLGTEQPLSPVTDAQLLIDRHRPMAEFGGRIDGPIVSIGELESGDGLALVFTGTISYLESDGNGGGAGDFTHLRFGQIGGSYADDAPIGIAGLRVPLDSSVVQAVLSDGTSFWQRPAGGYGLMELPGDVFRSGASFDVVAYDAEGTEIGRWTADF